MVQRVPRAAHVPLILLDIIKGTANLTINSDAEGQSLPVSYFINTEETRHSPDQSSMKVDETSLPLPS